MKKILLMISFIIASQSASADPKYPAGYNTQFIPLRQPTYIAHNYYRNNSQDMLVPLIVGGVVGYIIAQPKQQNQQPVIIQQNTQIIPGEPIYQYQTIFDAECQCERRVLVRIN